MATLLTNSILLTDGDRSDGFDVAVEGGRVIHVGPADSFPRASAEVIDLEGRYLAPGFLDLQVNGAGDALFQHERNETSLKTMGETLLRFGITGFLPTLTSATKEDLAEAISAVHEQLSAGDGSVLGINLEGPFINPKKAGMASAENSGAYQAEVLPILEPLLGEAPVLMTTSPEVMDAAGTKELLDAGVVVSIGHTEASYATAKTFFSVGVRTATHIFNAMSGVSGREPGVVGAIFDTPYVSTSFIADGHHVHRANARLAGRILGAGRIFLISDGMPTLGSSRKEFDYLGQRITETNGKCTTDTGMLAGTGVDLGTACRQMMSWLGLRPEEAIEMITSTPARIIGLSDTYGTIRPGAVANLNVLTEDLEVERVMVRGEFN